MSVTSREINEGWIVGAVRTPIGRHGGSLSSVRPDDLGALVLEALVERTGVPPEEVEDLYMGCANQAGEDNRNVARMSLLLAGFPEKIAGLPPFTGIAMVRYRLYGIDLPIDRTFVYGVLVGTLALMYFGDVATTQTIFRALTGQEEQPQPAVVVSTLVIAALTPKLVLVLLLRGSARWGMKGSQQTSQACHRTPRRKGARRQSSWAVYRSIPSPGFTLEEAGARGVSTIFSSIPSV
jgi:hypothetical protein